jgi:hypothetical protein
MLYLNMLSSPVQDTQAGEASAASSGVRDIVAATHGALDCGDLDHARRELQRLRRLDSISSTDLQELRRKVRQWLQHTRELRTEYAADLRNMRRRRQNAAAYQQMGTSPLA